MHPACDDRLGDRARDVRVVAGGRRHLQALLHRVLAERRDDLLARGGQRALGDVLADQVDRRDQRLRLDRQQARRAVEVVAVGLRVDLDLALLLLDLRVQHVGAAAEVDDVEHVHVLAQLLLADLQPLADLGDRHALARAPGLDQDARERHQAREALGADRGLGPSGAASPSAPALSARRARAAREPVTRGACGGPLPAAAPAPLPLGADGGVSPWRSSSSSRRRSSSPTSSSGPSSRAFAPSPSTHEIRLRAFE